MIRSSRPGASLHGMTHDAQAGLVANIPITTFVTSADGFSNSSTSDFEHGRSPSACNSVLGWRAAGLKTAGYHWAGAVRYSLVATLTASSLVPTRDRFSARGPAFWKRERSDSSGLSVRYVLDAWSGPARPAPPPEGKHTTCGRWAHFARERSCAPYAPINTARSEATPKRDPEAANPSTAMTKTAESQRNTSAVRRQSRQCRRQYACS
jgi:hypothetical protein